MVYFSVTGNSLMTSNSSEIIPNAGQTFPQKRFCPDAFFWERRFSHCRNNNVLPFSIYRSKLKINSLVFKIKGKKQESCSKGHLSLQKICNKTPIFVPQQHLRKLPGECFQSRHSFLSTAVLHLVFQFTLLLSVCPGLIQTEKELYVTH